MPRTTLDIDAAVLRELKRRQVREKKPLGQLASELMARALTQPEPERTPVAWSTAKMGRPNVDIDDKDALWAALDKP